MPPPTALLTLLDQAETERDEAQRTLQRARVDLEGARSQHTQLSEYRHEYEERYAARFRQGGSIDLMLNYQSFMARLGQALEHQVRLVQHQEARIEPARADLQRCETRVASIRKLIERRQDDERRAQERREQKGADEAATRSALRGGARFGSASLFAAQGWA